jgi:toxin-antitoxin system PIN domain toxin
MILPDVNVLVEAFRPDTQQHTECSSWLDSVVNGEAAYGMSPQVLSSVIRILTNKRVYKSPDPLDKVLAFADALLDQPHCQIIQPGPRHWRIFSDLCRKTNARGDLVPDAWFAALAIESGCEWITLDRDFRRFDGLRWRAPF